MPSGGVDRDRAHAVAVAAQRRAVTLGLSLADDLLIWDLAGWSGPVGPGPGSASGSVGSGPGPASGSAGSGPDPASGSVGSGPGLASGASAASALEPGEPGEAGMPDLGDLAGGDGHEELAEVLERSTSARQRRITGLHVTPPWLADHLVDAAFGVLPRDAGAPTVCDPACGGGAFLLAAARALEARGCARVDVVRHLLWGADVDPVGLAAAEVALALWSGETPPPGRLVVGDALVTGRSLWPEAPAGGFGAVVGNPPFLNQLERATTRPAEEKERLRARYGAAVRPYTDAAWLFLLLGCELVAPGGVVTMVQPLSVVAARDGAAVRAALGERARLDGLWVEDPDRPAFAASVQVCAPLLTAISPTSPPGASPPGASPAEATPVVDSAGSTSPAPVSPGVSSPVSPAASPTEPTPVAASAGSTSPEVASPVVASAGSTSPEVALPEPVPAAVPALPAASEAGATPVVASADRVWSDRLADAVGVPPVGIDDPGCQRLGDLADLAAGFRDEYYGLVPLVRDAEGGVVPAGHGPLVTTGTLDWGSSSWGTRPVRFAKRGWAAPVVDFGAAGSLDPALPSTRAVRRWLERTAGPKLLVATQTPVVELAVDVEGTWVPSVPTLAVVPHRPDDVWRVAAAVASPTATAWLWRRAPGTALSRYALKIAARDLAQLPLPVSEPAWTAAARAFRAYVERPSGGVFEDYVEAAARAYGAAPALVDWWRARVQPAIDSTRGD